MTDIVEWLRNPNRAFSERDMVSAADLIEIQRDEINQLTQLIADHITSLCKSAIRKDAEMVEVGAEVKGMSRHSRAMLLNVLWHHQGGSSQVGQPLRKLFGLGPHDRMTEEQLSEAKWIDAILANGETRITAEVLAHQD